MSKKRKQVNTPKRPRSWVQAIEAALLEVSGHTGVEICDMLGIHQRTLRGWRAADWWERDAIPEARDQYANDITRLSRLRLKTSLQKPGIEAGKLAFKVLERTDPAFAPPTQRVHQTGEMTQNVVMMDEKTLAGLPIGYLKELDALNKKYGIGKEEAT